MIARTMIFFCFLGFFVREVNGITIRCVAFTLDLVRQGHVTIQLTFPIIGTMRATTMIFFCFLGFLGQENQWHKKQMSCIHALPCASRSSDQASDLSYLGNHTQYAGARLVL